ncbi:MAG: hypothetical protein HY742_03940 [Deltaproteobacteria bacterium]|nr:hypothetical protein [Deltaproteobacteria bacterium]
MPGAGERRHDGSGGDIRLLTPSKKLQGAMHTAVADEQQAKGGPDKY